MWNVPLFHGEAEVLQCFIGKHAAHLEILALSVTFARRVGLVVPLPFLSHNPDTGAEYAFPRLHTLRLDNAEQDVCFGCIYRAAGAPLLHPRSAQGHALATDLALDALRRFVAAHAGITDLALTGLHDAETLSAIARACAQRPMRRMLVGESFDSAFRRHGVARGTAWRTQAEQWVYHEVLFKDLELSRPEYASNLLAVGHPRSRLLHHHGY
ncbi:hypothetical protein AURDEDRAFT_114750 [Auricularia subglabra TFB-10046 SS5]|nr:hypothetical protein AURDEDRAFT_114750 [Auricularia subglabra TFB-10046 SS5]